MASVVACAAAASALTSSCGFHPPQHECRLEPFASGASSPDPSLSLNGRASENAFPAFSAPSSLILRFPPNFKRQLSIKVRRNCSNIGVATLKQVRLPHCLIMQVDLLQKLDKSSTFVHAGERLGRPKVSDALTTPIVQTSTYTFPKTAQLIAYQQGTRVSCATRSTPSVDADDMEATSDSDMDGSATTSSSLTKRPWLTKLMLALSGCEKPWKVPWTSFTIFQVMFLWFCTFWLVGSWIIPFAAHYAGCSKDTLTYRGQALYSLITDIAEGTVGLGILHRCLARFKPLPSNWFPFSWRGQWYIDVLLGCLTFPVVNRLSQLNLELLPFPSPFTSYEQSIMARDPIASILYAIVVSVCCPIWEEVIFRGFLLPSLTRYLPMWASIFVSALVFGLAHFNVQRMLPLTFLGLVMGIMFVRSRNLLSSMLLHSLWNGFVFMGLLR